MYEKDSHGISDGPKSVNDCDKTFCSPSWEDKEIVMGQPVSAKRRPVGKFLFIFCTLHYSASHLMFLSCSKSRKLLFAEISTASIYVEA